MVKCRILFLALFVLILSACVKTIPTRATWTGAHGSQAGDAALEVWENEFSSIRDHFPNLADGIEREMSKGAEPLDAASRKKIDAARAHILANPECTTCWMWKDVLSAVKHLDDSVRLARLSSKKFMALYFFYTNQLFLNDADLATASTGELAAALVHEMTHRVMWSAVTRHTSFTRDEMLLLLVACIDFWQRDKIADEGVAYWNQVKWTEAAGLNTHGKLAPGALAWVHGDSDVGLRKLFAAEMLTPSGTSKLSCGPPVIVRGPNRGTYFDPEGLAPEILHPLLATALGSM